MSIELKDKNAVKIPTTQLIYIAGEELGNATPSISADRLWWHACIRLSNPRMVCAELVQGHGPTPRMAIANGIVAARRRRDAFIEKLAWLEKELGTSEKSDSYLSTTEI